MAILIPRLIACKVDETGIDIPDDPNEFKNEEYPHWAVLCAVTLGVPLNWGTAGDWMCHNAEVLVRIPKDEVLTLTYGQLVDRGVELSGR